MNKHTPGPWHVNSSGAEIVEDRGIVIAEVFDRGTETPRPQANARLIAAAPDMLRALQDFVGMSSSLEHGVRNQPYTDDSAKFVIENARSAIAKATGHC